MRAYVLTGDGRQPEHLLSADNWLTQGYRRSGLHQVEQLIPSVVVGRGAGPIRTLMVADSQLDRALVQVSYVGQQFGLDQFLAATKTNGVLVIRGEEIMLESCGGSFTPRSRHISVDMSQVFSGIIAGALADEGVLDLEAEVEHYVPELAGSAFGGATVTDLLEMTAAVEYSLNNEDPNSEASKLSRALGWRPLVPGDVVGGRAFLRGLRAAGPHGVRFHYCNGTTEILAWVLERVTGTNYADLLSARVWSCIGAEADAYLTVDYDGCPAASVGLGMRLRDLARFGLLIRDGGSWNGNQIVPEQWIERIRAGGRFQITNGGSTISDAKMQASYSNQWWIQGAPGGAFFAFGLFGQYLWIEPHSGVVIAKFSGADAILPDWESEVQALSSIAAAVTVAE